MFEGISPDSIRLLMLFAPPFIISLSIHEWAHAWTAHRLGDNLSRDLGRLTLDPMAHISWFGTVIFPSIAILTGSHLFFGWAKPVPVDVRQLKRPRKDLAIIAAAGPASNLIQAIILSFLLVFVDRCQLATWFPAIGTSRMFSAGIEMLSIAIQLNLFLAVFNLLPFDPLDGGKILKGFVSSKMADRIDSVSHYAPWILMALLFSGKLQYLAYPVFWLHNLIFSVSISLFEAAC